MRPAPQPLTLHARCRVAHVGPGEVLFVGQTSFAQGLWVGIHLDERIGKNDGSVQGKRYFECEPGYGLFVRPSQVQLEETPSAAIKAPASEPRPVRAESAQRTRTVVAPRQTRPPDESPSVARIARMKAKQGAAVPESPSARQAARGTPETSRLSPTKQLRTPGSLARAQTASARVAAARPSMRAAAPPVAQTPTPALTRTPARTPAGAYVDAAETPFKTPAQTPFKTPSESPTKPALETPRSLSPERQDSKLRAQISLLETQKSAAEARITELEATVARSAERAAEAAASAAEHVAAITAERDSLHEQLLQANEGLEMATLDREMAEERADAIAAELRSARDMAEELTLELQLRDECAEGDADANLAQQNARLREALIRLRDVTSESEANYKSEIASLRRELSSLDGVAETAAAAKNAEAQAKAVADELRTQLELAHGAEDMIEQLTEKNGTLENRVAQLTAEVRELEALRVVSDELEEAHIDTENELQAALDAHESREKELETCMQELNSRVAQDAETIERFRELVSTLAKEVETLRKVPSGAPRTKAVDLASVKAPLVTVAPARDRIAAQEAARRVDLIQSYLPARFFEVDAAAVDTLLFFERMCSHSDLIKHTLEAQTDVQEHLAEADESLVAACELRHALAHVSALSRQIAAVLSSAPPDVFAGYAAVAVDMQHVDARLSAALDSLQDNKFDERTVAQDCSTIVPLLEAVSMSLPDVESVADLAAKEVGSATLLVHDVDTLQAALGHVHHVLEQLAADPDIDWAPEQLDALDPMRQCVRAVRPSARRILRRLTSLYENEETITIDAIDMLPELGRVSSELVSFATKYAQRVAAYALHVRGTAQRVDSERITALALESMHAVFAGDTLEPILAHAETLAVSVDALLAGVVDQNNVIHIATSAPWRARAHELHASALQDAHAAERTADLEERILQLGREVRAREDAAQASRVKIERLEHQLTRAHEAASAAADLRIELDEARQALEAERSAGIHVQESDEPPRAPADVIAELDAVRRALHHVRQENMYIKSSEWRKLRPLATPAPRVEAQIPASPPPPAGEPTDPAPLPPAQALHELAGQLVQLAAAPRVVDLRAVKAGWTPARSTPAGQLAAQRRSRASVQWHISQLEAQLAR
ncbi:hypothetical protein MCUN1_000137 [Malassezia cuniculi]|uniref:CAP-Gly domain-containing protein n=1 Tax=Malassezia cuniculi TaxID=948313 RepID=A0AAF0ER20_9BASI|nr:hypothetical protein MCUN1_000137 [Malassezia cuniculi]